MSNLVLTGPDPDEPGLFAAGSRTGSRTGCLVLTEPAPKGLGCSVAGNRAGSRAGSRAGGLVLTEPAPEGLGLSVAGNRAGSGVCLPHCLEDTIKVVLLIKVKHSL